MSEGSSPQGGHLLKGATSAEVSILLKGHLLKCNLLMDHLLMGHLLMGHLLMGGAKGSLLKGDFIYKGGAKIVSSKGRECCLSDKDRGAEDDPVWRSADRLVSLSGLVIGLSMRLGRTETVVDETVEMD